jgi:hypothetical protein
VSPHWRRKLTRATTSSLPHELFHRLRDLPLPHELLDRPRDPPPPTSSITFAPPTSSLTSAPPATFSLSPGFTSKGIEGPSDPTAPVQEEQARGRVHGGPWPAAPARPAGHFAPCRRRRHECRARNRWGSGGMLLRLLLPVGVGSVQRKGENTVNVRQRPICLPSRFAPSL